MATDRKLSLPVVFERLARGAKGDARPTLEIARRRLGGRGASAPGAGRIVTIRASRLLPRSIGVVLFEAERECDVWVEAGVVRRTELAGVEPFAGELTTDIERMACDVRVFLQLVEGQRVRYEVQGEVHHGTLVEKCRYGALVATESGRILAVGFRKLWPVSNGDMIS